MSYQYIYTLEDPDTLEIRYVGKTNNIQKRLTNHICKSKTERNYKSSWIKSLLKKNKKPIINILDIVKVDDVSFWEEFYISLFKSWNIRLTNLTPGGDCGGLGLEPWNKGKSNVYSEEVKLQISTSLGKGVKAVNTLTNDIYIFTSIKKCSDTLKIPQRHISKYCKNSIKRFDLTKNKHFHFEYLIHI